MAHQCSVSAETRELIRERLRDTLANREAVRRLARIGQVAEAETVAERRSAFDTRRALRIGRRDV